MGPKLELIRYEYDLENPPGQDDRLVVLGAYDFPYNVAAEGTIYNVGISYRLPVDSKWVQSLTFYNDYAFLDKDEGSFSDTQQNVLGTLIRAGRLYIYVDFVLGKHHPWVHR